MIGKAFEFIRLNFSIIYGLIIAEDGSQRNPTEKEKLNKIWKLLEEHYGAVDKVYSYRKNLDNCKHGFAENTRDYLHKFELCNNICPNSNSDGI